MTPGKHVLVGFHRGIGGYRKNHLGRHLMQIDGVIERRIKPLEIRGIVVGLHRMAHFVGDFHHGLFGQILHEGIQGILKTVEGPAIGLGPAAAAPGNLEGRGLQLRPLIHHIALIVHGRQTHALHLHLGIFRKTGIQPLQGLARFAVAGELEDTLIGNGCRPVSLHHGR